MQMFTEELLSHHSTMRLGGPAAYLAEITKISEITEAMKWANKQKLPVIMIGDGSNIVWGDEGFPGLVLVNKLRGIEMSEGDSGTVYIKIAAGEKWDNVVEQAVLAGLSGIEALSLIPGTAGATPVQNVGAYGQEIANVLIELEAYDRETHNFVTVAGKDCAFGYRQSRFKSSDRDRYFITAITLQLSRTNPKPPFYQSLQKYLDDHHIKTYTPRIIRDAVIAIRSAKLPDPDVVANNGSFFANPIISSHTFDEIRTKHPHIAHWDVKHGAVKLSAAWLVEQAGFKDAHDNETGMATWHKQPLVLVNEHAKSTADLLKFRDNIINSVYKKFHIRLEQEPELIGD